MKSSAVDRDAGDFGGFGSLAKTERLSSDDDSAPTEVTALQLQQCCQALAEAEKAGKAFIALKWFRDSGLMSSGHPWVNSLAQRQAVVTKAIDAGAVLTASIPNPKSSQHPTTTVKLNRESEYARSVTPRFQPIRAKGGASASEIILRDRGERQILHFIDTSALLKLFIFEQGSDRMSQFADAESDRSKVVSALAQVEARSGITRMRKGKLITPSQASFALDSLAAEVRRLVEQPVTPPVLAAASMAVDRYCLRAMDAVQLGSAIVARDLLASPEMRFIASDQALLDAAQAEGFSTWNPIVLS